MQTGSIVKCLKIGEWVCVDVPGFTLSLYPKFGDICVMSGIESDGFLILEEYGEVQFDSKFFRELQPPLTISIDEILKEPQTV